MATATTTRTPDQIAAQLLPLLKIDNLARDASDFGLPPTRSEVQELCLRQVAQIALAEQATGRTIHAVVEADEYLPEVAQRLFAGLKGEECDNGNGLNLRTWTEWTVLAPQVVTLDVTASEWHPEALHINSLTEGVDVVLRIVSEETVSGRRLVTCEFEVE